MILDPSNIHDSWKEFVTPEIIKEVFHVEELIGNDYTPQADKVLRFLNLDLHNIKVVILGQDPYKPAGVANGRSFQPSNLIDWNQPFRQISLKNIVRAVYTAYCGIEDYKNIPSYASLVRMMQLGAFNIKSPYEWFDSLENQGVLFLNTSLTCRIGESNSHKEIWEKFSIQLIKYISNKRTDMVWFMWGKEAIAVKQYVTKGTFYTSRHPMMCSETYSDDFLRNPCFKNTMTMINWLG